MRMKKTLIFFSCVLVLLAICGFIIANALNNEKINILIYGLDGRSENEVERSDAIILINYNFNRNTITATSIPRDSYVKITCKDNQFDKINHAYAYGGEKCLNSTVKKLFGIEDIKNVSLEFENVIKIIDFFGVIEINPTNSFCQQDVLGKRVYCFEKDKKILIDGNQALAYMRARKSLPNGDFDRIKNQRQILKNIIDRFLKLSLLEKIKFFKLLNETLVTDINIKDINVKKLVNVQQINLEEYTLKGENYYNKYYYYKLDISYLEKIKKKYI